MKGGGNEGKCRPYGWLCERPPDPRGPQLSHQHSSPDWTCLKSYIILWIPPSSPLLSTAFPTSSPPPPPPLLPSAFHSETTTTKAGPSQDKYSPESNQFWEVIVQLLQLNMLSTSRMRQSPHECEKDEDRHSCNLSDQAHERQNSGCHWQSLSSGFFYITCISNPDDYSLEVSQWKQAYRDTDLLRWVITGPLPVFSSA